MDNPKSLLLLMADEIRDYEKTVFASAGLGTWGALDPSTVAEKHGGRILVDTGGLLKSLTSRGGGGVQRIAGDSVTVATTEISAVMAQRGARGMPKRNPAPKPSSGIVQGWARTLLGALIDGTR